VKLENCVVAVLGGGSETALTLGRLLLKEKAKLILIDSSLDTFQNALTMLEEWKENIRLYAADVSSQAEVRHALQYVINEFKKIDMIVDCTGTYKDWGL